ncbi:11740_t:CDS:1, partial [Funneliformis mosseae]
KFSESVVLPMEFIMRVCFSYFIVGINKHTVKLSTIEEVSNSMVELNGDDDRYVK